MHHIVSLSRAEAMNSLTVNRYRDHTDLELSVEHFIVSLTLTSFRTVSFIATEGFRDSFGAAGPLFTLGRIAGGCVP